MEKPAFIPDRSKMMEIGKHGDFARVMEVIVVESEKERKFYTLDGIHLGTVKSSVFIPN